MKTGRGAGWKPLSETLHLIRALLTHQIGEAHQMAARRSIPVANGIESASDAH
jgi:hypothetical protein